VKCEDLFGDRIHTEGKDGEKFNLIGDYAVRFVPLIDASAL